MDSPPTPMYVVHSPSEPRKRCIGVEVIGTTLHVPSYSVDAHHSTYWYSTYGLAIVARVCARPLRIGVREGALCPKASFAQSHKSPSPRKARGERSTCHPAISMPERSSRPTTLANSTFVKGASDEW
eukprot:scaffold6303_cov75-Phaeocystis_antarctica.AAC.2